MLFLDARFFAPRCAVIDCRRPDLSHAGLHVIATARSRAAIRDLEALGMTTLSLEVNDETSVLAALEDVKRITGGKLDILLNNAFVFPASVLSQNSAS